MELSFQKENIKDCCKVTKNLTEHKERDDITIWKCNVCGCRHFVIRPKSLKLFTRR